MFALTAKAFIAAFLNSLVCAGALYLGFRAIARKAPGSAKWDLSGVVALLALCFVYRLAWPQGVGEAAGAVALPTLAVLAIGLVFDYRPAPWFWRALALFAVGLVTVANGIRFEVLKVPFAESWVELGTVGTVVSALWLALFAGSFGRAATIPGVPSGVAALAGLTFWTISLTRPDLTTQQGALFAAALTGISLPLVFLAPRLRVGGATAGGYVLGFLVGVVSIIGALKNTALLIAIVPLVIVGAPLFCAFFPYAADLRSGARAIAFAPRMRHLHEILLGQGYTPGQVLKIILAGTVYLCAVAILLVGMVEAHFAWKLVVLAFAAAGGLLFFYVVLRMMPRPIAAEEDGHPHAVSLLGVRVHAVTMPGALAEAERFIHEDRPRMIVTTDASGLMRAHDDAEFREIVNTADLVTPDGAGVILSARLLNIPLEARCAGCDMVAGLCGVAAKLGRSVYLLGASPGVAEKAAEKLQEQIEGLEIAGTHDGYFDEDEQQRIIDEIKRTRPAVLFAALGIPKQEIWIRRHMEELGVPICVGVGGSFDVISGLKRRAPVWMQRAGLEWLYRVAKEPWRLPRLTALPRIVLLTFAELLRPPRPVEPRDGADASN